MSAQSEALIKQQEEYMESLTEGQLAEYLAQEAMVEPDEN